MFTNRSQRHKFTMPISRFCSKIDHIRLQIDCRGTSRPETLFLADLAVKYACKSIAFVYKSIADARVNQRHCSAPISRFHTPDSASILQFCVDLAVLGPSHHSPLGGAGPSAPPRETREKEIESEPQAFFPDPRDRPGAAFADRAKRM